MAQRQVSVKEGACLPGEATALIAASCYSLSYVLLRKGQAERDLPDHGLFPVLFISVLTLGASLALSQLIRPHAFVWNQNSAEAMGYSLLSGLIGTWLGRMALYAAIDYVGATRGVVIKSTAPLVTLIIAIFLLREKLDDLDATGMVCLLTGVAVVLLDRNRLQQRGYLNWLRHGAVLGVIAAILQGIGHAMRKLGTLHSTSALLSATVDVTTAFLAYTLWLLASGRLGAIVRTYRRSYTPNIIASAFLSAAAVLLFFTAVGSAPVSTVSVIIGTEPVLVAILSALLLRKIERLTLFTLIGSLLVALGVILTSLDQRSADPHKALVVVPPSAQELAPPSPVPLHFNQVNFYVKRGLTVGGQEDGAV